MQNETLEELIERNHKRERRIFIVAAAILLIAGVSWLIAHLVRYYQSMPRWESFSYSDTFWNSDYEAFQNPENEEQLCVVTDADSSIVLRQFVPDKYIVQLTCRGRAQDAPYYESADYEVCELALYDMVEKKHLLSIDILESMEDYEAAWRIDFERVANEFGIYEDEWGVYTDENGEKIFCIPISKIAEESILDEDFPYGMGLLLINLDNGKTEVASIRRDDIEETRQDFVIQWQEQKEDWNLWDGRQPHLILPRDTNIYWSLNGYVVMEIQTDLPPDQNEELYQRFPGLEAYKGQENKKVTFFFGGYPEPQEIVPLLEEE